MRPVPSPRVHLFVCANRREGSPLGPGCAERGEAVYAALKEEVARRGRVVDVWVTKTHCLGVCPKHGATVAHYIPPNGSNASVLVAEVEPEDAERILVTSPPSPARPSPTVDLLREIEQLEDLQRSKVLALARRLRPGLTLEDVQNPHDFPELDDPDWHYADGVLAGIASVKSALQALVKRDAAQSDANDSRGW